MYSWGEGKFGRLGHGHEGNVLRPLVIDALREVVMIQVSCGGFHTAAVSEAGIAYSWGGGEHGQLGHGDKVCARPLCEVWAVLHAMFMHVKQSNKMEPCPITGLQHLTVLSVSCGWSHTVGLSGSWHVHAFISTVFKTLCHLKKMWSRCRMWPSVFVGQWRPRQAWPR